MVNDVNIDVKSELRKKRVTDIRMDGRTNSDIEMQVRIKKHFSRDRKPKIQNIQSWIFLSDFHSSRSSESICHKNKL